MQIDACRDISGAPMPLHSIYLPLAYARYPVRYALVRSYSLLYQDFFGLHPVP